MSAVVEWVRQRPVNVTARNDIISVSLFGGGLEVVRGRCSFGCTVLSMLAVYHRYAPHFNSPRHFNRRTQWQSIGVWTGQRDVNLGTVEIQKQKSDNKVVFIFSSWYPVQTQTHTHIYRTYHNLKRTPLGHSRQLLCIPGRRRKRTESVALWHTVCVQSREACFPRTPEHPWCYKEVTERSYDMLPTQSLGICLTTALQSTFSVQIQTGWQGHTWGHRHSSRTQNTNKNTSASGTCLGCPLSPCPKNS